MSVIVSKSVTAADQWSSIVQLQGDDAVISGRSAIVQMYGGSGNTVSIRKYAADKTTIIDSMTIIKSQELRIPVTGYYDFGIASGNFGSGPCLITVEQ